MRVTFFAVVTIAAIAVPASAFAGDTEWRRYTIASTGTSVDMPVSIFTSDAGAPEAEEPDGGFSPTTAAPT